jgi:hypothetical protein
MALVTLHQPFVHGYPVPASSLNRRPATCSPLIFNDQIPGIFGDHLAYLIAQFLPFADVITGRRYGQRSTWLGVPVSVASLLIPNSAFWRCRLAKRKGSGELT